MGTALGSSRLPVYRLEPADLDANGALDLIESYANDAAINGLGLDRHAEEQAVELFASNILKAGEAFLEGGEESPFIPSWHRVTSVYQNVFADLLDAVDADKAEAARTQEAATTRVAVA